MYQFKLSALSELICQEHDEKIKGVDYQAGKIWPRQGDGPPLQLHAGSRPLFPASIR
jgi:hypothetical protein